MVVALEVLSLLKHLLLPRKNWRGLARLIIYVIILTSFVELPQEVFNAVCYSTPTDTYRNMYYLDMLHMLWSYMYRLLDGEQRLLQIKSVDGTEYVFQEYRNGLVYKPLDKVFVQQDNRDFSLSFIPQRGIEKLPLGWEFLCEDYNQKGILTVNVCLVYEEKEKIIEVKTKAEEREEVLIEPKIVEE